jgi:hypothetical protein
MPLSPWGATHRVARALRLGYSGIDAHDIQRGVQQLAGVLAEVGEQPPLRAIG